jgi:DNA sulfur modification protein DndB
MNKASKIDLPCLRGRMGDWFYYVTILKFRDVAERVKLPQEINEKYSDPDLKLSEWIQRDVDAKRIAPIVNYLKTEQRFFNSLILGIYDGKPKWHDIAFEKSKFATTEEEINYFSSTFGILSLNGDESIFAMDGQHRAMGIRNAVAEGQHIKDDEVAAIFVAHRATEEGGIRTRRLFSTLNRYAKPVSPAETIALSEDDNAAIITRRIVDANELLMARVLTTKNRAINPTNSTDFTNIMVLYDMVRIYLTDSPVFGIKVNGNPSRAYSETRVEEDQLKKDQERFEALLTKFAEGIPVLKAYFNGAPINRKDDSSSLLFRPIGQIVFISVLKVAAEHRKLTRAINFFAKANFNGKNRLWGKVFFDESTGDINTDKVRQRFATLLILEQLGIGFVRSSKDNEILLAFQPLIKYVAK